MQVTIFGASGKVGQVVVQQLLDAGHDVVAFTHSSNPFQSSDKLIVVKGDTHNQADVAKALQGSQAVISTLGSWHTPTKDILGSAMQSVLPAMESTGIKRIISLTGSAAIAPDERLSTGGKIAHALFCKIAPKIINDAEEHLRLLASSTAEWTVLRAPIISSGISQTYNLSRNLPPIWKRVPRSAVAAALVSQLEDRTYIRQAPHIS